MDGIQSVCPSPRCGTLTLPHLAFPPAYVSLLPSRRHPPTYMVGPFTSLFHASRAVPAFLLPGVLFCISQLLVNTDLSPKIQLKAKLFRDSISAPSYASVPLSP